jgi:hypothetical protein
MNKFKLALFIFIYICFSSSKEFNYIDDISNESVSILFIGNSLTYTNNLPELTKNFAKLKGKVIKTKMIALPNYALVDHWNDGVVQKEIKNKKYDFVIIQQGPSSQSNGREMLIEYGKKYGELCKSNNALLCYFMVWPSLKNYHTFESVIENHKEAASMNEAILLPVGEVWKDHIDSTGNFDYYSSDGFHPSLKGSTIAADIIVNHLFK